MGAGGTEIAAQSAAKKSCMTNPLIVGWELQLNTWPRKFVAIVLILAACGALIYRTWWLFMAAWITREFKPDPAIYERAIGYNPNNADYHFLLGQIYNSSTQFLDLGRAGQAFKEAVRLNPNRSAHWQELAKWYEEEKQLDAARDAVRHAIETDPNYAKTHWFAANLYLRVGDMKEADFEMRRAADLDAPGYLTQVLDLVWRFYGDPNLIVSTHVPNTRVANLIALNYLVSQKSEAGAGLIWARLKTFETSVPERFPYIGYLQSLGKQREAWQIFSFPNPPVAFYNGSFETESLQGGFDWRFVSNDDAEVRRDTTVAIEGLSSLMVSFSGTQNIDFAGVLHDVVVEPGKRYNLAFSMKTEGISTNEGIFVEVLGCKDCQPSEKQLGTTSWQQFRIPFTATGDVVTVRLRRVPTSKFDNLLKGKVWVDAFDLVQ
jgi:tetratricopeptide (TPR) repeat protein